MLEPGSTFLIPSGPRHDPGRHHLHIVIARKSGPPRQVLLVSVCSIDSAPYDTTVVLNVGDHPFIQHPSYVNYRYVSVEEEEKILRGVNSGEFTKREDCSEDLLTTIKHGLQDSPQAKPFGQNFLSEAD